jgi:hypothetical protein
MPASTDRPRWAVLPPAARALVEQPSTQAWPRMPGCCLADARHSPPPGLEPVYAAKLALGLAVDQLAAAPPCGPARLFLM